MEMMSLFFLASEEKTTPDVVRIKQPNTGLKFGLPSIIGYSLGNSSSSSSLLSSVSSRFIYLLFFLKNVTHANAAELPLIPHTQVVYALQQENMILTSSQFIVDPPTILFKKTSKQAV